MKSLLKLVRSLWFVALLVLSGLGLGTTVSAIGYDGQTQPTIAYDAHSASITDYDAAHEQAANETRNGTTGNPVLFAKFGELVAAKTTAGRTIGLGLDLEGDLARARAAGGLIYENGAWQRAGLTTVDWGRASVDNSWFRMSFREAAQNADAIRFDVSNFSPAYPKPGMTTFEFNHIVNTPGLLPKTTFIQNGQSVIWNGSQFVRP